MTLIALLSVSRFSWLQAGERLWSCPLHLPDANMFPVTSILHVHNWMGNSKFYYIHLLLFVYLYHLYYVPVQYRQGFKPHFIVCFLRIFTLKMMCLFVFVYYSIQFTFICITLFTIHIISKQLCFLHVSTIQFRVFCYQRCLSISVIYNVTVS